MPILVHWKLTHYCIFGLTDIFVLLFSSSLPFYTINPCEYLPAKCMNVPVHSIMMSFSTVFWLMIIMGCYWQLTGASSLILNQVNKDRTNVLQVKLTCTWSPEQVSNLVTCDCFFWPWPVSSPSSSPVHRLCSKPLDTQQMWSARCQSRLAHLWLIRECHNWKSSLWYIEKAKKKSYLSGLCPWKWPSLEIEMSDSMWFLHAFILKTDVCLLIWGEEQIWATFSCGVSV